MVDVTVDVVVLAGGTMSAEMQAETGVTNRALIPLGDRTMLAHVIAALRGARGVGRIFVVGDVPNAAEYQPVKPGASLLDNLLIGLHAAGAGSSDAPILVSTADIPFLTAASVDDYLRKATATGGDLCYPIVPLARCSERFPEMKRTALKLKEGRFTGGNLMLINPRAMLAHQDKIQRAYATRKSPLALGRMLGWGFLLRILLSQTVHPNILSVKALEAGVSRLLGCRAAAVVTEAAEIGTDVDKVEDIRIARRILTG